MFRLTHSIEGDPYRCYSSAKLEYVGYFLKNGEAALKGYQ